mgnify:CR=1 FL=1
MKRTYLAIAAMAALISGLTSCDEKLSPEPQKATIDISIDADGLATKGMGTVATTSTDNLRDDEKNIRNLQVFVFNGDARDGYVQAERQGAEASITRATKVECTSGVREIWCIANAPSLSSVTSKTALLATVSLLTRNSTANGFVMTGFKSSVTIAKGNKNEQTIPVKRIASKIVVKNIENALRTGGSMKITRVYITNVAGQINYGLDTYATASGTWLNKGGYTSASGQNYDSVTQDINLTANVAAGSKYTTNHFFYAYPNNYPQEDYSDSWTPRRTMLVVQIEYNSRLYDYPIDLGVDLESNKMYVIDNLKLQNLGNVDDGEEGGADEENPISGATVSVSLEVMDWTVVSLGTDGEITI